MASSASGTETRRSLPESREPLPGATPMALAMEWVARITAVSLLMFLPGVAGQWLDDRFGTKFLTLVGFGFGFCAGLGSLLVMVKKKGPPGNSPGEM
jgi:hypothetical protein